MILVPIFFVGMYCGWQIYKDHARVEASREFARIDYSAHSPERRIR